VSEILSKDPPPMRVDDLALPAAAEATIRKALSKAARDRFATIEDAVAILEPYGAASSSRHRRIDSTEPPPPMPMAAASHPTSGSLPGPAMVSAHHKTLAERAPRRRLPLGLGAAIVLAVAVGYVVTRPATLLPAPVASETPSAIVAAAHTAITDVPPPHAASGEVAAAYLAGVQGIRDASLFAAATNLERAAALDPTLAAAHLKLAWLYAVQGNSAAARVEGARATELAASLGARDRALLDAISPLVVGQPPDAAEADRRLTAVSAESRGDAELAFVLGRVRQRLGDSDGAQAALDRALADDPRFAAVDWARAVDAEDRGDVDAAIAEYTRCLEASSSAASCLAARGAIAAQRGDCAGVEADARRLLGVEPGGWRAYESLARALVARGRPLETVREALKREWLLLPDAQRARREQLDDARLAVLSGDFVGAEARMHDLEKLGAAPSDDTSRVDTATFLVALYDEEGDARRAGAVAHEELTTRATVPGAPTLLAAAARAGVLAPSDLEARRDAWIERARDGASSRRPGDLWLRAYAAPAETADEAKVAEAALASFLPPPLARDLEPVDALYGKVLLLAGRIEDALPHLRAAAATCLAFDDPFVQTRASSDLGRALEARGDKAGACDAYATVLARWGHATPRSLTATAAAARSRALGCAKP
jgi:serine/threonine-protein kinase